MAGEGPPESAQEHHRLVAHTDENRARLRALGRELPVTPASRRSFDAELVRRLLWWGTCLVLLGLVVGGTLQWLEPIPVPSFQPRVAASIRLGGALPSLPWPLTGEAVLSALGAGSLGDVRGSVPVPIASLATVMTALVVLHDHPLGLAENGPTIDVTAPVVAADATETSAGAPTVPVTLGEQLTERQALEALLVAQGDDVATLLADWDAGSVATFVQRMNTEARRLSLAATTFADPAGLDPATTSTAASVVRLGAAAMRVPAFAQIVELPQVTLPVAGLVYNQDYNVTHDGFVGIEAGASPSAGGCYLFADEQVIDGQHLALLGAVLGQVGVSPLEAALASGEALVNGAFGALRTEATPYRGAIVADITTSWGATIPVRATSRDKQVLVWPGLVVPVSWSVRTPHAPLRAGASVGTLRLGLGMEGVDLTLRTLARLTRPSNLWRITRV